MKQNRINPVGGNDAAGVFRSLKVRAMDAKRGAMASTIETSRSGVCRTFTPLGVSRYRVRKWGKWRAMLVAG